MLEVIQSAQKSSVEMNPQILALSQQELDRYGSPEQAFMEPETMPEEGPADMGMEPMPGMDGYAFDTAYDEIEQAIDQVSGQPMSEGPIPEQPDNDALGPLEDPYQMQQYMYDPYMQQLMNPYMMPDQMGFGPMGPMPGP